MEKDEKSSEYASPEELKSAISALCAAFSKPNAITTNPEALKTYGYSEHSYHPTSPHAVIVRFLHTTIYSPCHDIRFVQTAQRMSSRLSTSHELIEYR